MKIESMIEQIKPAFEIYGSACFDAQHLERGVKLLIALSRFNKKIPMDEKINSYTLGDLFKEVKSDEYFTSAETSLIHKAIRDRNFLIHKCWDTYLHNSQAEEGGNKIVQDLHDRKNKIRKASAIIDDFIDKYLEKHNTSLNQIVEYMEALWIEDTSNTKH